MGALMERIKQGKVLVSDGAMGSFLIDLGLRAGECPESWCVSRPESVRGILQAYVDAGSEIIETNSFGGNSVKLGAYGLAGSVAELNRAAAALAREIVGSRGFVFGSVGPTGQFVKGEGGKIAAESLYDVFKPQVMALAEGGADAICMETMWSLQEAAQAIRAAKENTGLPVICTFTFNAGARGFRTAVGLSPERAAAGSLEAGADVIGANCGNGIDEMIEITKLMRAAAPNAPILIHANAGLPAFEDGKTVYRETPDYMASRIPALMSAGATIIGGCCGTAPAHIAAIAKAVRGSPSASSAAK